VPPAVVPPTVLTGEARLRTGFPEQAIDGMIDRRWVTAGQLRRLATGTGPFRRVQGPGSTRAATFILVDEHRGELSSEGQRGRRWHVLHNRFTRLAALNCFVAIRCSIHEDAVAAALG
jgi:hypothetical protein